MFHLGEIYRRKHCSSYVWNWMSEVLSASNHQPIYFLVRFDRSRNESKRTSVEVQNIDVTKRFQFVLNFFYREERKQCRSNVTVNSAGKISSVKSERTTNFVSIVSLWNRTKPTISVASTTTSEDFWLENFHRFSMKNEVQIFILFFSRFQCNTTDENYRVQCCSTSFCNVPSNFLNQTVEVRRETNSSNLIVFGLAAVLTFSIVIFYGFSCRR